MKHSPVLIKLSHPIETRSNRNKVCYVYGKTNMREVVPCLAPLVSSYVEDDLDDNFYPVYRVSTRYCYNKHLLPENQTWHEYETVFFTYDYRTAIETCESRGRAAYAKAITNGVGSAIGEAL